MENTRTLTQLLEYEGTIYIYCVNNQVASKFLRQAEDECFIFGNGIRPTEGEENRLYTINREHTINYGTVSSGMAFSNLYTSPSHQMIRVDYIKYAMGVPDYFYYENFYKKKDQR